MAGGYPVGSRVALRALQRADAEALSRVRDDPDVARYQSWRRCTLEDAQALIEEMLPLEPDMRGRWYQFGIVLSEGGELIGDCAIRCPAADPKQAEIGFTLGRAHWGKGYASEAVRMLIDWLFGPRGKRRIFAITDGRNFASQRLLGRLGFRRDPKFDRLTWFKGEFGPESVWVIEKH